jgi:hypothetical protein
MLKAQRMPDGAVVPVQLELGGTPAGTVEVDSRGSLTARNARAVE